MGLRINNRPAPIEANKKYNRVEENMEDPLPQKRDLGEELDQLADRKDNVAQPAQMNHTNIGRSTEAPGSTNESRWWDVYNNEAKKIDNELIKDCRDSLNSLLVFAAIFAAVLTAFIIESKKLLEEDQASVMVDVMIFYANNRANDTRTPYAKPPFQVTAAAISINCLLFASLGASLIAALAGVVALQWVADYDAAIVRGGDTPLEKAVRRHFRFSGVEKWKMIEVINVLPILIFIGVVLFFAALIQWMLAVNSTVGFVVVGGAAIAALFYCSSTLVAVISAAAPFRTAPARWIYSPFRLSLKLLYQTLQVMSFAAASEWIEKHYPTIDSNSRGRDDRLIKSSTLLERETFLWIARHVSLSRESYGRWMLLLPELARLIEKPKQPGFETIFEIPWRSLTTIAQYYYDNSLMPDHTVEDTQNISVLVLMADDASISQLIVPEGPSWHKEKSISEYWTQGCLPAMEADPFPTSSPHPLFLLTRDLPSPSLASEGEMRATLQLSKWRNSLDKGPEVWRDILGRPGTYTPAFLHSALDMLCQFIPCSEWNFADKKRQATFISLFTNILERGVGQELSPRSGTLLAGAFGHLVCGKESFNRPMLYGRTLLSLPRDIHVLHDSVVLILARTLINCPRNMLPQRLKEVVTMVWLTPDDSLAHDFDNFSVFFKSENTLDGELSTLYRGFWFCDWPRRLKSLPSAPEVLECVVDGQRWCRNKDVLLPPEAAVQGSGAHIQLIQIFDNHITFASTAAQYSAAIETLCHGLEDATAKDLSHEDRQYLSTLKDPCIRFIASRFLRITLPDTEKEIKEEFVADIEALLLIDLPRKRNECLAWEVWAWVWGALGREEQQKRCREARTEPQRIRCFKQMGDNLILRRTQYDHPSNLWRHLLEADLSKTERGTNSLEMVTVLDDQSLFDGLNLQGEQVLGLLAGLLYAEESQLKLPPGVSDGYVKITREICTEIKARPLLMLAQLDGLLKEFEGKIWRRSECAIILKLYQDGMNSVGELPTQLRCSMVDALRSAVKSWGDPESYEESWTLHNDKMGGCMIAQANALLRRLLIELYRTPSYRSVPWPQYRGSTDPVGGWLSSRRMLSMVPQYSIVV